MANYCEIIIEANAAAKRDLNSGIRNRNLGNTKEYKKAYNLAYSKLAA